MCTYCCCPAPPCPLSDITNGLVKHVYCLYCLPVLPDTTTGLVKLLGTKGYLINHTTSGTLTHLAPERLQSGSLLTAAADVYGFGILMYELYTGSKPYAGLSVDKRLMKLIYHGLRPQFPASTPPAYRALAEACWSQNMAERPTFDSIMHQLQVGALQHAGRHAEEPLAAAQASLFRAREALLASSCNAAGGTQWEPAPCRVV